MFFFYERDRQLTVVKNEHITTHTAITLSADAIDWRKCIAQRYNKSGADFTNV